MTGLGKTIINRINSSKKHTVLIKTGKALLGVFVLENLRRGERGES